MPVATGGTKLWEQVNPGEEQKKPDGFRPIVGFGGAPGVLKGSVKGGVKTSDRAFCTSCFYSRYSGSAKRSSSTSGA